MGTVEKLAVIGALLLTACRGELQISQPPASGTPFADAGTGSTHLVGSTITLDATGSFDPDGRALAYHWQLASGPAASHSTIPDASVVTSDFVLDAPGTYVFDLTVTSESGASATSSVTNVAVAPSITVDPGADQSVSWRATVQLSGMYEVEAGVPASAHWTFTSRPLRSTATLVGADTLMPTFFADAEGDYVVQLTVQTAYNTASATVTITAKAQREILGYTIVDIQYSAALDRLVIVSDTPPALRIHDPVSGAESSVALSKTPYAVSIEPSGLRAVVSHDHLVSLVDLQNLAVIATYAPPLVVQNIVFGADGRVHCLPRDSTAIPYMYTITLATGAIVQDSPLVWARAHARLHPNGLRMYVPSMGVSPGSLQRWDVSASPIAVTQGWSSGQFPQDDLWFIRGGAFAVSEGGGVFASTDGTSTDMTYQTTLAAPVVPGETTASTPWAEDSAATGTVALVSTADVGSIYGNTVAALATYDDQTFAARDTILLPDTPYNGMTYNNVARFVTFGAGTKPYVVVDATYVVGGQQIVTAFSAIYPIP